MTLRTLIILSILSVLFAGCAKNTDFENESLNKSYKEEVEAYKKMQKEHVQTASLWNNKTSGGSFFLDSKARQVGDIIIINIIESASASNSNSTQTSKSTNLSANTTSLLGLPTNLGMKNFLGTGNAFDPTLGVTTDNSFDGQGKKKKSDSLEATIAARIIDILPSGNLVVEGQREIVIDQEKQTIKISGIVRQKDVAADNTIPSTAVADAKISYSGKGLLTDNNRPGWLTAVLNWIWPF